MAGRMVAVNELGIRIGEYHQNARYTDREIGLVLDLREEGKSYGEISKLVEMPKTTVRDICKFRRRSQTVAKWRVVTENE